MTVGVQVPVVPVVDQALGGDEAGGGLVLAALVIVDVEPLLLGQSSGDGGEAGTCRPGRRPQDADTLFQLVAPGMLISACSSELLNQTPGNSYMGSSP